MIINSHLKEELRLLMKPLLMLAVFSMLVVGCRQREAAPPSEATRTLLDAGGAVTPEGEAPGSESGTPAPETTPTITPTPAPPKDLVVCISVEPASLYLYGDNSPAASIVRQAIYEAPYTSLNYDYQPLALDKVPNLVDGDATLEAVEVVQGDLVVDTAGQIVALAPGVEVLNSDGQPTVFDGNPVQMTRLSASFTFKPLVWSDGTPVTAEDSVLSFRLAGDRTSSRVDSKIPFTFEYEAIDERTVRWTGLPGYVDQAYMTNVWTPLPSHQLAELSPAEVLTADNAVITPLSYGAFVVDEWTPEESIRLIPNPHYYRSAEGLPYLTSLTFRFIGPGNTTLPEEADDCHIITDDALSFDVVPALEEATSDSEWVEHTASAGVVEQIIFGVNSAAADSEANPSLFAEAGVRQAIVQCIDREAMVGELTYGRASVLDTLVSGAHPLYPEDASSWPYHPVQANTLLDELGYLDVNGDGIREDLTATRPFSVTLGTNSESQFRLQINEMTQSDLAECGINVDLYSQDAGSWFAPGPGGTVFGRRFDMAQIAWVERLQPDCSLYLTENIPGSPDSGYRGWDGTNVSGWSNEAFDAACRASRAMVPGQSGYEDAQKEAMRIFSLELPAVPLFSRMRLALVRPDVLNFHLDATQSALWNVAEVDLLTSGN
jgi:peptide/nickel transport system substrate-binding protein